jgi:hypothetical protein
MKNREDIAEIEKEIMLTTEKFANHQKEQNAEEVNEPK